MSVRTDMIVCLSAVIGDLINELQGSSCIVGVASLREALVYCRGITTEQELRDRLPKVLGSALSAKKAFDESGEPEIAERIADQVVNAILAHGEALQ